MSKASQVESNLKRIETAVKEYFAEFSGKGGTTWSFEFKSRGNKSVDRSDYLDIVFKLINTDNSGNSVDLKNSQHCVVMEIVREAMVFAILPQFKEYKKYNLTYLNTFEENKQDDEENHKGEEKREKKEHLGEDGASIEGTNV